jgi:hypothetical protein
MKKEKVEPYLLVHQGFGEFPFGSLEVIDSTSEELEKRLEEDVEVGARDIACAVLINEKIKERLKGVI